jgi:predicted GTPase
VAGAERVVILGAAGRDFHNFNVVYRDDPTTTVVAFTATQIPGIDGRRYPPSLAGPRYPAGIPIEPESALEAICRRERVSQVVFAYSDVTHAHVMRVASRALATGADFVLLGPERTMLRAAVPVVAVSAVRTGCGKSPIARWLGARLRAGGRRVAVLRHPMPYSDLERQRAQRFEKIADLDAAGCTVEEREEYEPHLAAGNVVFAGVDYALIAAQAAAGADVIVWDGGNNDFPFLRPDLHLVVVDALRPHDARGYHPGEAVLQTADLVVVNKVDAATPDQVARAVATARAVNPSAPIVRAASPVRLDDVAGGKRAARDRGRGRPHHHARLDAARRRLRRGDRGRRDRGRPEAGGRTAPPRCVRPVPPYRPGRAGGGLQPGAARGPAAHAGPSERRRRHRRDPGRSGAPGLPRQADHPRALRLRRSLRAGARRPDR